LADFVQASGYSDQFSRQHTCSFLFSLVASPSRRRGLGKRNITRLCQPVPLLFLPWFLSRPMLADHSRGMTPPKPHPQCRDPDLRSASRQECLILHASCLDFSCSITHVDARCSVKTLCSVRPNMASMNQIPRGGGRGEPSAPHP